jgi:hypothetical protein
MFFFVGEWNSELLMKTVTNVKLTESDDFWERIITSFTSLLWQYDANDILCLLRRKKMMFLLSVPKVIRFRWKGNVFHYHNLDGEKK